MTASAWLRNLVGRGFTPPPGDTDSVRRIAAALDGVVPARARYLAAFAYVLCRAADPDLEIGPRTRERMAVILQRAGDLSPAQAARAVDAAVAQSRLEGGTEDFLVTREFRSISSSRERRELLDSLLELASGGDGMSPAQQSQLRQVASELGIPRPEFIAMRRARTLRPATAIDALKPL